MTSRLEGRRVRFRRGWPGPRARPGGYCKVPNGVDPRGPGVWYAVAPDGKAGAIVSHQVVEHDDGTITVSPSLVMPSGWHGWLEHGVWRSV